MVTTARTAAKVVRSGKPIISPRKFDRFRRGNNVGSKARSSDIINLFPGEISFLAEVISNLGKAPLSEIFLA